MDGQRSGLQWFKWAQSCQFLLCAMDHTSRRREPEHQSFGNAKRLYQYDLRGAEWDLQSRCGFWRTSWATYFPSVRADHLQWLYHAHQNEGLHHGQRRAGLLHGYESE